MPENKQFTDHLKVVFADDEIRAKGVELAKVMQERDAIENERKSVNSDYKGRIDAKTTIIKELQNEVNVGHAYLPVKCEIRYNEPTPGQATIVRLDTGEVVNVREMTGEERQVKITDFSEVEQADAPFDTVSDEPITPAREEQPQDQDRGELSDEERDGLLRPAKYTSDEFVKEFQTATAAKDAELFKFAPGVMAKMADKKKIKILRQDETGTVFTMGSLDDGLIFFDKDERTEVYTTIDLIDGRIKQLEDAILAEPDSPGKETWEKEIVDLKAKRVKLVRKERKKDRSEEPPAQGEPVTKEKPAAKKKSSDPDASFAKRSADWFIQRIGKQIDAQSEKDFNGVMEVEDQEHAEYLASVAQNQNGYTFRDVQAS